jgi:hypothetical protein
MNATSRKMTKLKPLKRLVKRIISGKAFEKKEFGTSLFDMTLLGAIGMRHGRPAGYRKVPSKLVLRSVDTTNEHASNPIRIFIGSEPAQHRGERVLLWSILKHRNPSKHYEVSIMKDLAGFERKSWKTGFTAYRYAIPEFASFQGRAIYNDVDQIYLADPFDLLGENMSEAAVLAVESRDTSVMLMDCGRLADIWTIATVRAASQGRVHATMLNLLRERSLIADLPGYWNSRDHEYDQNKSRLLHYTTLQSQPWRPFPKELRYRETPQSELWYRLEKEADQHSFAPLWKHQPDRPYADMKDFYSVANHE